MYSVYVLLNSQRDLFRFSNKYDKDLKVFFDI